MLSSQLSSESALRAALNTIGPPDQWSPTNSKWLAGITETLSWIQAADLEERASLAFQQRLWNHNRISNLGRGNVSVDAALEDESFRHWLAEASLRSDAAALHPELLQRLKQFSLPKVPHAKVYSVLAALFPAQMTTVVSRPALESLATALGCPLADGIELHLAVRKRVDAALPELTSRPADQAARLMLPWLLFEKVVQGSSVLAEAASSLVPLPASRRRRGLSPTKGTFPLLVEVLDFVVDGATLDDLVGFLRERSAKGNAHTTRAILDTYRLQLDCLTLQGDRYSPSDRGHQVIAVRTAEPLADWLLTQILGVDNILVDLRDQGPRSITQLYQVLRESNPNLTADFGPKGLINWLISFGLFSLQSDELYHLTELGADWAFRIYWAPEKLPPTSEIPVIEPLPPRPLALPPLPQIIQHIQADGHHLPASRIAHLHAGLWAHPRRHFAILTGLSGAGKTLLAQRYAEALAGRLLVVPVQPAWHDPSSLLGYHNPLHSGSYATTPFLEFLISASENPARPHVAILDEMNLSHPEQYLAPLLSCMETGQPIDLHQEAEVFDGIPDSLPYPSNLVLIGTVNMDETTHGLSDKVLDRAFVMEFWNVDLEHYPRWNRLTLSPDRTAQTRSLLADLMLALAPSRLHFGWRVVDDVLDFLSHTQQDGDLLPFSDALDSVILSKVLPKLRGEDSPAFRKALDDCAALLPSGTFPHSIAKIEKLRADLRRTGIAHFWR